MPSGIYRSFKRLGRRKKQSGSSKGTNEAQPSSKPNNTQAQYPKLVIKNGVIDWESSQLEDCHKIIEGSEHVRAYMKSSYLMKIEETLLTLR